MCDSLDNTSRLRSLINHMLGTLAINIWSLRDLVRFSRKRFYSHTPKSDH